MKIAVISDTHDNLPNFKKALEWIKKQGITTVLHCGDICKQETIDEATKDFPGQIKFVRGNGDINLDELPETSEVEIGVKKIGFAHYPWLGRKMAKTKKYSTVFFGHIHMPWRWKVGKCALICPGNLSGVHYRATFAVYDTESGKLELKMLETLD